MLRKVTVRYVYLVAMLKHRGVEAHLRLWREQTRGGQRGNQQREDHDLPERAQRAAYAVAEVRSQSLPGGPFFGLIAQAKGEANRGLRLNSFSEKTNFM